MLTRVCWKKKKMNSSTPTTIWSWVAHFIIHVCLILFRIMSIRVLTRYVFPTTIRLYSPCFTFSRRSILPQNSYCYCGYSLLINKPMKVPTISWMMCPWCHWSVGQWARERDCIEWRVGWPGHLPLHCARSRCPRPRHWPQGHQAMIWSVVQKYWNSANPQRLSHQGFRMQWPLHVDWCVWDGDVYHPTRTRQRGTFALFLPWYAS